MLAMLAACNQSSQPDAAAVQDKGMTYASLAELPDWSGWWTAAEGSSPAQLWIDNADLFQPAARERVNAALVPNANLSATGLYCRQFRFVGDNGGAIEDVEFLFTPGRLTITNESGLLRRIALDGSKLRDDPEPSNGGTSVGQWQADTLLVQTIGLHGDAIFPAPIPGGPLLGEGASVNERIRLLAPGKLEVQTEIIAPAMLKSPLKFTTVYRRDQNHVNRDLDLCADHDRSIDPATGLQRFDLSPPADLPPPPGA
ncbi:MAG: hypothetical protein QM808_14360 [Steroidobacteraceae bacterium]